MARLLAMPLRLGGSPDCPSVDFKKAMTFFCFSVSLGLIFTYILSLIFDNVPEISPYVNINVKNFEVNV